MIFSDSSWHRGQNRGERGATAMIIPCRFTEFSLRSLKVIASDLHCHPLREKNRFHPQSPGWPEMRWVPRTEAGNSSSCILFPPTNSVSDLKRNGHSDWGCSSVGGGLTKHAQGSGFDLQRRVGLVWRYTCNSSSALGP